VYATIYFTNELDYLCFVLIIRWAGFQSDCMKVASKVENCIPCCHDAATRRGPRSLLARCPAVVTLTRCNQGNTKIELPLARSWSSSRNRVPDHPNRNYEARIKVLTTQNWDKAARNKDFPFIISLLPPPSSSLLLPFVVRIWSLPLPKSIAST